MRTQSFASPEEALQHYGVKGMRWGVRKQEDTGGGSGPKAQAQTNRDAKGRMTSAPASPPASSVKQQQRVEKFLKQADVMSTRIADLQVQNQKFAGSKNPGKAYVRYANNQTIRQLESSKKKALKDAEGAKKGHKLTSTQKKVIIGGVVVGTLLAAGTIAYSGQQSGAFNQLHLLGEARLHGNASPFALNHELSKPMSAADLLSKVAKPVNPGYSKAGGKMNCRRSTYAYELRRRGFDVHATTSAVGWGQSESGVINAVTPGSRNFYRSTSVSDVVVKTGASTVAPGDKRLNPLKKILVGDLINSGEGDAKSTARILKNVKAGRPVWEGVSQLSTTTSSSKRVLEELAKQPNGARGEVLFKFPGFGHSMAYEIVDGVPHIFDSQKGTLYNEATKMVESKWDGFHSAEITRLDNANLDLKFLARWATNNP